jgi:hypothetical protein
MMSPNVLYKAVSAALWSASVSAGFASVTMMALRLLRSA